MSQPQPDESERADTMQWWRVSPVTKHLAQLAIEESKQTLIELLGACSKSEDPNVARWHERFVAVSARVDMLMGPRGAQ